MVLPVLSDGTFGFELPHPAPGAPEVIRGGQTPRVRKTRGATTVAAEHAQLGLRTAVSADVVRLRSRIVELAESDAIRFASASEQMDLLKELYQNITGSTLRSNWTTVFINETRHAFERLIAGAETLYAIAEEALARIDRYMDRCDRFYLGRGPREETVLDTMRNAAGTAE